jgi:hypothetical protein
MQAGRSDVENPRARAPAQVGLLGKPSGVGPAMKSGRPGRVVAPTTPALLLAKAKPRVIAGWAMRVGTSLYDPKISV